MTFRIVFRHDARIEYENSALWYERQRPGLGEAFARDVEVAVGRIAEAPQRYAVVFDDVRRAATRRFSFNIYFRVRENTIVVLAIFHASRNPARVTGRS